MTRLVILLALLSVAPLCAHEASVFCNLTLPGTKDHSGIKVSVEADPLFGYRDAEALAVAEETRGKFAKVVISGEGETDKIGAVRIKVEFSFDGEGVRPTRSVMRDRQQAQAEYCMARLVARRDGFRTAVYSVMFTAGEESRSVFEQLSPLLTVRGSVMHLSDRSPAAGLDLVLTTTVQVRQPLPRERGAVGGHTQYKMVPESRKWSLKTDANGEFKLTDESMLYGRYVLAPSSGSLAFSTTSKAAHEIELRDGDNDLGALMVVPGGTLKLRVVNTQDKAPVNAYVNLSTQGYQRGFTLEEGACEVPGIVEGEYKLSVRFTDFWEVEQQVVIRAGTPTDLGDIELDPYLSLEVIALSDSNAGIETYNVTARMLEGLRPPSHRHEREFVRRGYLTAERTVLPGLRRGKWLITVEAKGHAKGEAEVELPANEPLTVTLSQGGTLQVSVRIGEQTVARGFALYAVRCDSSYHTTLSELTAEQWKNLTIDVTRPGVYTADRSWGEVTKIENMASGDYLVIAIAGYLGWLKRDGVLVESGKTTTLELTPEPAVLIATVTRDGKQAAGVSLFFVMCDSSDGTEFGEAQTAADGTCIYAFKSQGRAYALTERELLYMGKPGENKREWQDRLRNLKGTGSELLYGQRGAVAIELHDRNAIWLTLLVQLPESDSTRGPFLSQKPGAPARGWHSVPKKIDGGWLYPSVPAGEYVVEAYVRSATGEMIRLSREIKVETAPEQTIEIEFYVQTFTVALEVPTHVMAREVTVQLLPAESLESPEKPFEPRQAMPNADGNVVFLGMEPGKYLVVATAWDRQGGVLAGARREVDTSRSKTLSLKLKDDYGTLDLRVEGNPAIGGRHLEAKWRVQFYDDLGEEVLPLNPLLTIGQTNAAERDEWRRHAGQQDTANQGVRGIPSGTYRVLVSGYGLQPVFEEGVQIKRGQTTKLTVTPSAAALLKLTIENMDSQTLIRLKAKSAYFNARGTEVEVIAPGKRVFNVIEDRPGGGCETWLLNLTPDVTSVLIKMDGYEDIVIPVRAEPGKTILHTAKAVLKMQ